MLRCIHGAVVMHQRASSAKYIEQETKNQDYLRYNLATALCIPIIHVMPTSLQIQTFSKHICALMEVILDGEESDKTKDRDKSKARDDNSHMEIEESKGEQRTNLIQRICAFAMVEALYASLPGATIRKSINMIYAKSKLGKKETEIKVYNLKIIRTLKHYFLHKFLNLKGNELTSDIMRAAHATYTRKKTKQAVARFQEASQQSQMEGMDIEPATTENISGSTIDEIGNLLSSNQEPNPYDLQNRSSAAA